MHLPNWPTVKFGKNFDEKIDICLFIKNLGKKTRISALTPPKNEKLKSSVFWMN